MRIWHEQLIPKLCSKHLVAVWREALGAYKIITENKKGYRNHPATQEFVEAPEALHARLTQIKQEADNRNYNFKTVPDKVSFGGSIKEWQSLEEQTTHLKSKLCKCNI